MTGLLRTVPAIPTFGTCWLDTLALRLKTPSQPNSSDSKDGSVKLGSPLIGMAGMTTESGGCRGLPSSAGRPDPPGPPRPGPPRPEPPDAHARLGREARRYAAGRRAPRPPNSLARRGGRVGSLPSADRAVGAGAQKSTGQPVSAAGAPVRARSGRTRRPGPSGQRR
jgi:hypothetical protein